MKKQIIPVGIDGCKGGWLVIWWEQERFAYKVISHFREIEYLHTSPCRILVDTPIGLSQKGFNRTLEQQMRKQLGNRSSTVFNAPTREALYATTKEEAKRINKEITGKSLSEQSLNIFPKIREVDQYLRNNKPDRVTIYESHPEICFSFLAGNIIQSKKSTPAGIEERLEILEHYESQSRTIYHKILSNTLRKDVKRDDIADALCLCVVNKLAGVNDLKKLTDGKTKDLQRVDIGVYYYEF